MQFIDFDSVPNDDDNFYLFHLLISSVSSFTSDAQIS